MEHSTQPRTKRQNSNERFELLNSVHTAPAGKTEEMNRYLKTTTSTVQPGNSVNISRNGSQNKPATRASIKSDMSSFDQTLLSFRDIDSAKKLFRRRLRTLSGASCLMAISAAVLAIVDIEVVIRRRENISSTRGQQSGGVLSSTEDTLGIIGVVLKAVISLLSLLTCITIFKIYVNTRKLYIVKHLYHESESFIMSPLLPNYLIETLVCILHIPPFVDNLGVPYKLQLIVLLRLYLITRCLRERSKVFNNQATNLLASVTKTEISSTFLVKTYFLKEPFQLIFSFYSLNIFLGGYCVYVIEESHTYLDTVWMLVVTMTTLGFGDVVPVTVLARGFVGFASVLGIFLMALFISVVHEVLQLTQQEKRILAYIEKAENLLVKKIKAANCIKSCWRLRKYVKKHSDALEMGDWLKLQKMRFLQHKLFDHLRQWRAVRRASTRDDYWRKLFVVDDTAMLLTDVCRSVSTIQKYLQIQNCAKTNKTSFSRQRSRSLVGSPSAMIREEHKLAPDYPSSSSYFSPLYQQREHTGSVQAMSVDSWRARVGQREKQERRDKPDIQVVEPKRDTPRLCANHLGMLPRALSPVERTEELNRRTLLSQPEYVRKTSDLSTSSDHIDRGIMPFELLQSRIDSVEKSLDQIYGKVKTELRDIKDAIFTLAATTPGRTPLTSPGILPREDKKSDPIFSYASMDKYDI